MKKFGLNEIREKYLSFFESKGHLRLPSAPLVPQNDPSLLLINSGMAPLKPYFTGAKEPPQKRITTCQKCIRTPDIDNVGKTARHGTFFEMLGNFSFGNYFKNEAIEWAWEFVTKILELPEDRLWVTIYQDDDEAFEIWHNKIGVKADKIVRLGKDDNFWEIGVGPCGPCSEIYFDRGPDKGCGKPDCSVACNCDRYIEFWNLVFTQFDRDEQGNYNKLANPNIDTGMGLERMAAVMQEVDSIFEVDTIKSVLDFAGKLVGKEYGKENKSDVSLRIIADHMRGTTFMVSDGVVPSNEGRGYVLRRLIRRAARQGRLIGLDKPFLSQVAGVVIQNSRNAYPELGEKEEYIKKIINIEEEKFGETIEQGLQILNDFIKEIKEKGEKILSGEKAFKLYDTYGFPPDLTKEILSEYEMEFDEKGFAENMCKQKEQGRASWQGAGEEGWDKNSFKDIDIDVSCSFSGYTTIKENSKVIAIIKDNKQVEAAEKGDRIGIVLDVTPFYAESGGQIGDTGIIFADGIKAEVTDTHKFGDNKIMHLAFVSEGKITKGSQVVTQVDSTRRSSIMRNHSATHLLQKALREILGEHVSQAGSLVQVERLRFDFNHFTAMSEKEIAEVEKKVNDNILKGLDVETRQMSLNEAKKLGATALFGEKYGQNVRLVNMGGYSLELCGGCHVENTSRIGLFKILSETGVAAGVRRIEAITGYESIAYLNRLEQRIIGAAAIVKSTPQDFEKRIEGLVIENKTLQKENEKLRNKMAGEKIDDILLNATEIKGIKFVAARFDQLDAEGMRNLGDRLRNKIGSGVVVLAGSNEDKVNLVVMATKDAVDKGIHSGNIIREIAKITGGGGGGRPDMAQAGGRDASKVEEALKKAREIVQSTL